MATFLRWRTQTATLTYSSYAMSLLLTSDIRHTIIQMVLRSRILFLKKNSVKSNQLNQAKKSVTRQSLPTYIRKDSKSWHLLLKAILHLVNCWISYIYKQGFFTPQTGLACEAKKPCFKTRDISIWADIVWNPLQSNHIVMFNIFHSKVLRKAESLYETHWNIQDHQFKPSFLFVVIMASIRVFTSFALVE